MATTEVDTRYRDVACPTCMAAVGARCVVDSFERTGPDGVHRARASAQRLASEMFIRCVVTPVVDSVRMFNAAISTWVSVSPDGQLEITMQILERDTGERAGIRLCWDFPHWGSWPSPPTRDRIVDWIYLCLHDAWVHELNEALHVDGVRRRDLHDERGDAVPPPECEESRCRRVHPCWRSTGWRGTDGP
jgi:hypothetical protein